MKKIFMMLMCLAGMLMSVTSAHAATYNFNALNLFGGSGGWNVVYSTADHQNWTVTVAPMTGPTAPFGGTPTHGVSSLVFSLLDSSNMPVGVSSANNGTSNGPTIWSPTPSGTNVSYAAPSGTFLATVGDMFTGSFTTVVPVNVGKLGLVASSFDGGGFHVWGGSTNLTPEMPGGVLLLAALLPLGLVLRSKGAFLQNVS